MNARGVTILAGIVVLMLILVAVNMGDDQGAQVSESKLFPGLGGQLNSVTAVKLMLSEKVLTLENQRGVWQLAEKAGYPADFDRISELLKTLAEAELLEKKTSREENYERLGLDDETVAELQIVTADSTLVLLAGMESTGRSGHYVRLPGDSQTWLIGSPLSLELDATAWLDKTIVDINSDRIKRVSIHHADRPFVITRDAGGDTNLVGIVAGEKLKYPGVTDSITRALSNVSLTDVDPVSAAASVEMTETAEFELDNGLLVSVLSAKQDDNHFLQFKLTLPDEADAVVSAEYEALKWLENWRFTVASYTYEDFIQSREDLIESTEEAA